MATLLSLTTVGIGDLDLLLPSPPCLIVNTFYVGGEPESSVTHVWQDAATGALLYELVYMQPAPYETALAWAQERAATHGVDRIHFRHALRPDAPPRKASAKRSAKKSAKTRAKKPAKKSAKRAATKKAGKNLPKRKAPAKRRVVKRRAK